MQRHHSSATFSSVGILLECLTKASLLIRFQCVVRTLLQMRADRSLMCMISHPVESRPRLMRRPRQGRFPMRACSARGHFNYRLGCFIRHPHHTMGKPLRRVYPNPRMKFPSSPPCMGPSTIKAFIARRSGLGSRPPCIYILRGSRTQPLLVANAI